jgi:hypothetical protein
MLKNGPLRERHRMAQAMGRTEAAIQDAAAIAVRAGLDDIASRLTEIARKLRARQDGSTAFREPDRPG